MRAPAIPSARVLARFRTTVGLVTRVGPARPSVRRPPSACLRGGPSVRPAVPGHSDGTSYGQKSGPSSTVKMSAHLFDQCLVALVEYPYFFASTIFLAGMTIYYRLVVMGPVTLHSNKNSAYTRFLVDALPILGESYCPTFWCFESRFQTVFASFVRGMIPDIVYRRQILRLKDGGEVSLDWLDNKDSSQGVGKDYGGPIILFLPGLTGHSQSEYIKSFINVSHHELGARSVVFNFRGRGGHTLTTPRTYCASNSEDIDEVVTYIKATHPKAPLMAVGVSLGGIILGNYLSQQGERAKDKIKAAMVVSVCWDTFKGTESLEKMGLNRMLNWHLANCLVDSIKGVSHHFDKSSLWDLDQVFSSRTIREFDARFTSPLFGYSDVQEYYKDARLAGKLNTIQVPLLALNAEDDPFQPGDSIPNEEAMTTDSVAIITTRYGGHIGFMEGLWPTRYHFSDRLFAQFAKGVFHSQELLLNATQPRTQPLLSM